MQRSSVVDPAALASDPVSEFFEPSVTGKIYRAGVRLLDGSGDGTTSYYTLQELHEISAYLNNGHNKPLLA